MSERKREREGGREEVRETVGQREERIALRQSVCERGKSRREELAGKQ